MRPEGGFGPGSRAPRPPWRRPWRPALQPRCAKGRSRRSAQRDRGRKRQREGPPCFHRLQYPALRLQNCTSTLMLQPNARQTRSEGKRDLVCVPVGRPEQLQCVCCETGRAVEAAVSRPRMPVILSHVLTAHHNWPEARMRWHHMVDILRGVAAPLFMTKPRGPSPRSWMKIASQGTAAPLVFSTSTRQSQRASEG